MTISTAHPEVTPRTAAATAAKMRKSEERWAEHLRGRGWAVVEPAVAQGLHSSGTDHEPGQDCGWCDGYRAALRDVLGTAESAHPDAS